MNNSLVSVIVPIYNVEKYLPRCVESIINQEYKNLEIILVDDGSPDNSPQICDEYAKKDTRIKVIHKENGGLSDARNAGMKMATGEYVSFIDSDDWIDSKFISLLYEGIKKSGADVAECATRLFDDSDHTLKTRGSKEEKISRSDALSRLITENGVYQTVWNKLYKRSMIENIPFAVGKYHEDDFWTWRIFLKIDSLYLCEKPMYNYLQRSNSIIGSSYSLKKLDGAQARYERMLGLKGVPVAEDLAAIAFVNTLIYSMQCSVKYLNKEDKKIALKRIKDYKSQVSLTSAQYDMMNQKERMWIKLFMLMPKLTVKFRNIMGIGF